MSHSEEETPNTNSSSDRGHDPEGRRTSNNNNAPIGSMNYQQDALRRLTTNRSAASVVANSASSETRRANPNQSNFCSSNSFGSNRTGVAASRSNVHVEEEADTDEFNVGEVSDRSLTTADCYLFD